MSLPKDRYKVVIIAPTCFYYQSALFRTLSSDPRIDLVVYFCSKEGLHSKDIRQMYKSDNDWGQGDAVIQGYSHRWLMNFSPRPSYLKSLYGLVNLGVWREIIRAKPDVVVLMSWMNPTWWLAILACLCFKIPYLYMTDANVTAEKTKGKLIAWAKKLLLGKLIFRLSSGFLCAGTANKELYQLYNVPDQKLVPFAYSWGFDEYLQISQKLTPQRKQMRANLGIPDDTFVILYCGRLSREKGIFHLLEAYHRLECVQPKALILVGDGDLKKALRDYVATHGLESVRFVGFQNRQDVNKYYTIADVVVLPSLRETWGMVVTEALCFSLPVIASDQVGASADFLRHGQNGFTFPVGDVGALADRLRRVMQLPPDQRLAMGLASRRLMECWSGRDLAQSLVKYLDRLYFNKHVAA